MWLIIFFFNDTATTEIYTLSLHDALPIFIVDGLRSLKGVECNLPGGSFFVFPKVKGTGMDGEEFTEKCLQEVGVAMIPGTAFGKFASDYVRFNFATSRENISKAIEKIDKILK